MPPKPTTRCIEKKLTTARASRRKEEPRSPPRKQSRSPTKENQPASQLRQGPKRQPKNPEGKKSQPQGGQAKTSNASQSHAREGKPIGTRAGKRKPAAQCPNSKAKDPGSSATNNEKNGISYKCNDGCATHHTHQ